MNTERRALLEGFATMARTAMAAQPESTWTIAKMKLVYPSPPNRGTLVSVDNLAAAGNCRAQATSVNILEATERVQVEATFADFRLTGTSNIIGRFEILIQEGKSARGLFSQRHRDSFFPIFGSWEVPFVLATELGRLIPRHNSDPVLLRSAEPGEFTIPPIGTWFEKWDPVDLVREDQPDGATIAVCEHAMHCMINIGHGPQEPPFCF